MFIGPQPSPDTNWLCLHVCVCVCVFHYVPVLHHSWIQCLFTHLWCICRTCWMLSHVDDVSNHIDTCSRCLALLCSGCLVFAWLGCKEFFWSDLTQVLSSPLTPMPNMYSPLFLSRSQPQYSKFSLCFSSVCTFQPLWQIFWHQKRHAFSPSFDIFYV